MSCKLEAVLPTDDNISLYIHWPYCLKKCPYCDFNSYVTNFIDHQKWQTAYLNALKQQLHWLNNKPITSVFFGGGTPSLMQPQIIESILNFVKCHNKQDYLQEVTLECNPSTFEIEKFKTFQQIGINRLSIGIQSFNDTNLQFLGRNHNTQEAILALEQANAIFNNVSFDLIMGLPHQTLQDWQQELYTATRFFNKHLSIYQLTIEPNTVFFKNNVQTASEDEGCKMYQWNIEYLTNHNLWQYEISNFAKPQYASIHNINYWRGGEYIGVGPNAHGRVFYKNQWYATQEYKNPNLWLNKALNQDYLLEQHQKLSFHERFEEIIMTSLRMNKSIEKRLLPHLDRNKINTLIQDQLMQELNAQTLQLTNKGRECLNYVISTLLT